MVGALVLRVAVWRIGANSFTEYYLYVVILTSDLYLGSLYGIPKGLGSSRS